MNKFQGLIAALFVLALTNVQGSSGEVNYECIPGEGPTGMLIRRTTTTITVVEEFAACDCSQQTPTPPFPETTTTEEPPRTPTFIPTTEDLPHSTTNMTTTEDQPLTTTVMTTTNWSTNTSTTHSWNSTDTTTGAENSTEPLAVDLQAFCAAAGAGYYSLPNDPTCQGYVYCSSSGPIVKYCSADLYFNEESQTCSSKKPGSCNA